MSGASEAAWRRLRESEDPQGPPFTREDNEILRRLLRDVPDLLEQLTPFKAKKFVRTYHMLHAQPERRFADTSRMLRAHLEWRRQVAIDDFLAPETEAGATALRSHRRWRPLWGSEIHGLTRSGPHVGTPVLYHAMGAVDPAALFSVYPSSGTLADSVETALILDLELSEALTEELSRQVGTPMNLAIAVVDLRGIGASLMSPRLLSKIRLLIDLPSCHYPETLRHMYIINAPMAFRAFWRIILPFIPEENKRKITLLGTNAREISTLLASQGVDESLLGGETGTAKGPGWLETAYERAVATGQYLHEGIDLGLGASAQAEHTDTDTEASEQGTDASEEEISEASDDTEPPEEVQEEVRPARRGGHEAGLAERVHADAMAARATRLRSLDRERRPGDPRSGKPANRRLSCCAAPNRAARDADRPTAVPAPAARPARAAMRPPRPDASLQTRRRDAEHMVLRARPQVLHAESSASSSTSEEDLSYSSEGSDGTDPTHTAPSPPPGRHEAQPQHAPPDANPGGGGFASLGFGWCATDSGSNRPDSPTASSASSSVRPRTHCPDRPSLGPFHLTALGEWILLSDAFLRH